MKTTTTPVEAPKWHVVDASGQTLGRLATSIAHVLRGKHKVDFSPDQLCGDQVIVINAGKIAVESKKLKQKEYISHTGYMGHLKAVNLQDVLEKHPERVIENAVKGMLPKNRLRASMLKRMHVYAEAEHKCEAQNPTPLTIK